MKTHYRVGQRVWYVDTVAFHMPQGKVVCWYKPIRATITGVDIEQHLWLRGKRRTHNSVKYHVCFDAKWRNRGYPQQNENIFRHRQNALEYANLTNDCIRLYPFPQETRIPPTIKLRNKQKAVRRREPIEDNVY